jgi:flagellar hook-associated protein 3 FlgL
VRTENHQSIFSTLNNLIDILETPTSGTFGKQNLAYGLEVANSNIDNALDNVLTVRASVGSRLKELDTLDNAGEDKGLQYAQRLSELQDLDYVKALTDLSKQQVILEAAQKSFVQTSGLSLFKFI